MLVHIALKETEDGERNVLGAFTEKEEALLRLGEYAAEHPDEKCFLEVTDTEKWLYEADEYKVVHRTRVSKTTNVNTHVIYFAKEDLPLIEEGQGWYIIQQENKSFDREEGLEKNLRLLQAYLLGKEKGHEERLK